MVPQGTYQGLWLRFRVVTSTQRLPAAISNNLSDVKFPEPFDKTPLTLKIFITLRGIDMDSLRNSPVEVSAGNIDTNGLSRHGDSWENNKLYAVYKE
ncbi:hypothetical protein F5X99DRAFT_412832 [Biscogniauxia marginata]|nr:hypothetical protein F5X99DRAFT_412832 [Biscogniauxia marginata]